MTRTTADGLAAWLSIDWDEDVAVDHIVESSAGARRRNVRFDARTGTSTRALVATIVPSAEMQLIDVATEAAMRTVAARHGVAVPSIRSVCDDDRYVDGPFFVSDFVEGETIPRRVLRLAADVGHGSLVVEQLGDALARLHGIEIGEAPELLPRPPAHDPIAFALDLVRLAMSELLQPEPTFAYGLRWLEGHRPPEPARLAIIHTDVRNGNIMIGPDGLRAILDWEGSRIGDAMEDVAWPCTRMWRFGADDRVVAGLAGIDALRSGYEAAGGVWDVARFEWWRALGTLRWGLGLAGQAAAHLDGRFRSIVMAGSGRRVPEMAYDLLMLVRPEPKS